MIKLAAITACVGAVCAATTPISAAHAQQRPAATSAGAGGAAAAGAEHRARAFAIIRSYEAGEAPVPVAPARARLRLITDYDAGAWLDVDPANLLPAVVISAGAPTIARLGLFTTYDGTRAEPLQALSPAARPLAIVREYDPPPDGDPTAAPASVMARPALELPELAIGGEPAFELGAIVIAR